MRFELLLSTVVAVSVSTAFGAPSDFVGSTAPMSFEKTTQVPGDTLKAGSYSISVVEQISDRMIVRIDSTSSTNHAIFLGIPSTAAKIGGNAGVVTWPNGVNKAPTVRGFVFPNGSAVEFVYPKAEAAALAKENSAPVVAIDPKSEGRAVLKSLSRDELEIVNLWLLSLTATGAENKTPAILAKHYDPTADLQTPTVASGVAPVYPVTSSPATRANVATTVAPAAPVVMRSTPVAPNTTIARVAPAEQPVPRAQHVRVAPIQPSTAVHPSAPEVAKLERPQMPGGNAQSARRGPAMAQLPHTAGSLPTVWMIGILSFFGAGLVRFGRSSRTNEG